jgi:hypothetical protein
VQRIARSLIYLLAALYAGYWLVLGVPGLIAGIRAAEPWQVNALSLVPGIGLVLLPAAYCCHVATTGNANVGPTDELTDTMSHPLFELLDELDAAHIHYALARYQADQVTVPSHWLLLC